MSNMQAIPQMRPISDLRTHLNDIESEARESGDPIVLTRNGIPSLVVMDSDAYNERVKLDRHVHMLREAEIEAKYRKEAMSLEESKSRLNSIAEFVEAYHA